MNFALDVFMRHELVLLLSADAAGWSMQRTTPTDQKRDPDSPPRRLIDTGGMDMKTSMMVHGAQNVTLDNIFHENSRSLGLRIDTATGSFDLTIFNLPDEFINRAIAAFGEPERWCYHTEQAVYPKEMADLRAENARLRAKLVQLSGDTASALEASHV